MTAFNVVRFRVKPGEEQRFIDQHRKMKRDFKGFLGASLIKTGDRTYCLVGEWRNFKNIVAARPQMIAVLDEFRSMLEELGGGLGVTDPVSGEVVVKMTPPKTAKKKRPASAKKKKKRKTAKRAKRARR
jgi:Antibiotic biosynthesis monooxygenase